MKQLELASGWELRLENHPGLNGAGAPAALSAATHWLPATVPGANVQDLLRAGLISDPYVGLNERDVAWVGEGDWTYRLRLDAPSWARTASRLDLVFDGLDTFCTVLLNGEEIATSADMFIPLRVPLKGRLLAGGNTLELRFASPWFAGKRLEAERGASVAWNGDVSRVQVRKAQYHYGWDWGPCILSSGPWRAVRLEAFEARLADVWPRPELTFEGSSEALLSARVLANLTLDGDLTGAHVTVSLLDPDGREVSASSALAAERLSVPLDAPDARLWWPAGHGEQPLYRLRARLERDGALLDERETRFGLRSVNLDRSPLPAAPGEAFTFRVNNRDVYCGGANWIPDHLLTTMVTPERYLARVLRAREANMTMLRVWGGGIFEDPAFYDACDELGLLVWQDFMYACGVYPATDDFLEVARREAEVNVLALRHHPSLVLWAGNNEDYQTAQSQGMYGPGSSKPYPARAIYERVQPDVCAKTDPDTPYWPGSPYGGEDPNDQTRGDHHTWDVWHGVSAPIVEYPRFMGRFVSEFGMEAFADPEVLAPVILPGEDHPWSRSVEQHNKSTDGVRRLAAYIADEYRIPATLPGMSYLSQVVQADAAWSAFSGWRRFWGTRGARLNSGALIWQFNDCWPAISWAILDSENRAKLAFHATRRALTPLMIGAARDATGRVAVWAMNSTRAAVSGRVTWRLLRLDGGVAASGELALNAPENSSVELGVVDAPADLIFVASLETPGATAGQVLDDRVVLWPTPFKHLEVPDPELSVSVNGDFVRVTVAAPARAVVLQAPRDVEAEDSGFDLLPGEEKLVRAPGLNGRTVTARSLRWPVE